MQPVVERWLGKISWLFTTCSKTIKPHKILLLGLDCAGKSSALTSLKCTITPPAQIGPTMKIREETVNLIMEEEVVNVTVIDCGGQDRMREAWRDYLDGITGILYIVDASDKGRVKEASKSLIEILSHQESTNVPVVLVANKQDISEALNSDTLIHQMDLTLEPALLPRSCCGCFKRRHDEHEKELCIIKESAQHRHRFQVIEASVVCEFGIRESFELITKESERFIHDHN